MVRAVWWLLLLPPQASRADVSAPASLRSFEDAEALRVARAFFDAAARDEWSATDPALPFRYCTAIQRASDYSISKKCVRLRSRAALTVVTERLYPKRPRTIELDVHVRQAATGFGDAAWLYNSVLEADRIIDVASKTHTDDRFVVGVLENGRAVTLILRKQGSTFQVTGWVHYAFNCDEDPC
jgi:hypothetical protein